MGIPNLACMRREAMILSSQGGSKRRMIHSTLGSAAESTLTPGLRPSQHPPCQHTAVLPREPQGANEVVEGRQRAWKVHQCPIGRPRSPRKVKEVPRAIPHALVYAQVKQTELRRSVGRRGSLEQTPPHPGRQPAHSRTIAQWYHRSWDFHVEQIVPEVERDCHHSCSTELSRAQVNGVPIDARFGARQARHVGDPFYATPTVMAAVRAQREHEIFAR